MTLSKLTSQKWILHEQNVVNTSTGAQTMSMMVLSNFNLPFWNAQMLDDSQKQKSEPNYGGGKPFSPKSLWFNNASCSMRCSMLIDGGLEFGPMVDIRAQYSAPRLGVVFNIAADIVPAWDGQLNRFLICLSTICIGNMEYISMKSLHSALLARE